MTTPIHTRVSHVGVLLFPALLVCACSRGEEPVEGATGELAGEHQEEVEHTEESGRVQLSEAAFLNAGIVVGEVDVRDVMDSSSEAAVPGHIEFDPARIVLVSPRASGRIERLTAVEGDRVRAGQPVAYLLSPAFLTAQNDFLHAVRRAELLAGTADEEGAAALADAARRRLKLLGAGDGLIGDLAAGGAALDLLPITAPFDGSIIEAHALAGAAIEPGSPIFTLADLSAVNVVAEVPERSLATLRRGDAAEVRVSAYPDQPIRGTVERIRHELDPSTRTAEAVIRVPNPARSLRAGMFASVQLSGGDDAARVSRPVIPASAVVTEGAERYVFVEVGPRTFERRDVDVESLGGGELVVRAGLEAGARVVVRGAFTLKSELAKGEFGGDHH